MDAINSIKKWFFFKKNKKRCIDILKTLSDDSLECNNKLNNITCDKDITDMPVLLHNAVLMDHIDMDFLSSNFKEVYFQTLNIIERHNNFQKIYEKFIFGNIPDKNNSLVKEIYKIYSSIVLDIREMSIYYALNEVNILLYRDEVLLFTRLAMLLSLIDNSHLANKEIIASGYDINNIRMIRTFIETDLIVFLNSASNKTEFIKSYSYKIHFINNKIGELESLYDNYNKFKNGIASQIKYIQNEKTKDTTNIGNIITTINNKINYPFWVMAICISAYITKFSVSHWENIKTVFQHLIN